MERLHTNCLRDLIYGLCSGETKRRIALDLGLSRPTIHKYHVLAERQGFFDPLTPLPEDAILSQAVASAAQPPCVPSMVEPHR